MAYGLLLHEELRNLDELLLLRLHELERPLVRLVDHDLRLLVHGLARGVAVGLVGASERARLVLGEGELAYAVVHAVHLDHLVDHAGDAPEIVAGAGGDGAEHDLLRGPAGEGHADDVLDLGARPQEDLLGEVLRKAQRAVAAWYDGDLHERVSVLEEPAGDGVSRLVVRHDLLLLVANELVALEAADDPVARLLEVDHGHRVRLAPRGLDGCLVAHVGDVRACHARGEACEAARVVLGGALEGYALEVHEEDLLPALDVGLIDSDLPVEPAGAGEGLVEDVGPVGACKDHDA
mmetsp:Transcript_25467/g.50812  ORF Transcript_25467/g.50812 Transcript_25467/m.50812 type:complete len:293 (+) Transcript_25467:257-1135(+)